MPWGGFRGPAHGPRQGRSVGKRIIDAIWDGVTTTAMLLLLIAGAILFGRALTLTGASNEILQFVLGGGSPYKALSGYLILLLFLGMFLNPTPMMLLTLPIAHPILTSLGFDGVWLGIVVIQLCEIGLMTPPVATNVYAIKTIVPDLSLGRIFLGVTPFIIMGVISVALIVAFPTIALWLPKTMMR